jgi:hypothetical protein
MTAKLSAKRGHPAHQVREIAREAQQMRLHQLNLVRGHSRHHLLPLVALFTSSMTHRRTAVTPCSRNAVAVQFAYQAAAA